MSSLLASLPERLPGLPDTVWDEIEDAALVTAWGRGAVPRNGYGRREIEGIPVVEEPMRLVQQLGVLARGVLALGLPEEAATAIGRRVAVDTMPEARRAVLEVLATGQVLSTSSCARQAHLHRHVARMTLEDLAAIGVVENDRPDTNDEYDGAVNWQLSGEAGEIISRVFEAFHQSGGGWHETWLYTSTSPQIREEDSNTGVEPTLRATPDDGPPDPEPVPPDAADEQAITEDFCTICGHPLWAPQSQQLGICVKCWPITDRDANDREAPA